MTNGNSAERERFETAYLKRYPNIKFLDPERFSLDEQGEYRRTIVEVSWQLWQEGRDQGYVSGYSDGMRAYQWSADDRGAGKIYRHIMRENGQAAKRTSPENICDVLAALVAISKDSVCADGGKDLSGAEPVEESDVRPKERLCGGSHISCNGVDYCLGHPSCRDIANERAEKEKK
jgi:hypothetical protein